MSRDLSVLIPARSERWLARTVADVCTNLRGKTDVIVVLDGALPEAGFELPVHPAVSVVYHADAIGQRAAVNLAAKLSDARYVLKLDAHCSLAEGFDVALVEAAATLGPQVTQIPAQKHLRIFDQVCDACGRRYDQSPARPTCKSCGGPTRQEVVWTPRASPTTSAWRFDADLQFQYWNGARKAQRGIDFPEILSCLGACWFMDRTWFLETLGGLDESHGSWGQMGTEIACKSWLSGGRMVVNKSTWFAHFFRVGGHGFPYPIAAREQEAARVYSRALWRANAWPGQVEPLRWLVDKFWPVPGWTEADRALLPARLDRGPTAGIVYYSDGRGDPALLAACRAQLTRAAAGRPIVSVTLAPLDFGLNIVLEADRGYLTMFRQILAGLEALETDVAFLAEHDCWYAPEHFAFVPPTRDRYYYDLAWWKVDRATGRAITYTAKQTSQLCADRALLVAHYRERVRRVEVEGFSRAMGFEPGSHRRAARVDDIGSDTWRSSAPTYDIRHGQNLTPTRWSPTEFRDARNCQQWQETTITLEGLHAE